MSSREKKWEKEQYLKARQGLTVDEVVALDKKEAIVKANSKIAHGLHIGLFPEEYDHMYDSRMDMDDRKKGINPMSQLYIDKTNAYREELGFAPYRASQCDCNGTTFEWVVDMVSEGKEGELSRILKAREAKLIDL
tara:strand:+ start:100 stop:507 length:408 start_codon:yes stop_codon:yes gene_type:complete